MENLGQTTFADKQATLHQFFTGEGLRPDEKIVCPWGIEAARKREIVYVEVQKGESDDIYSEIFRGVREYCSSRKPVLTLIAPEDPETHDACRLEASRLFCELSCALAHYENSGTPLRELKRHWREEMFGRLLKNPKARISAGAISGRESQNVVAMGPRFPLTHPRYAPHLILVCIRAKDIIRAGQENPHLLQARYRTERERLQALGVISEVDPDGKITILDNEFYPSRYIQIDERRYQQRLAHLMANPQDDLIEED